MNSDAETLSTAISIAVPGAIIGGQIGRPANAIASSRAASSCSGRRAVAATAAVWLIERRAGTTTTSGVPSSVVDGGLPWPACDVARRAPDSKAARRRALIVVAIAWVVRLVAVSAAPVGVEPGIASTLHEGSKFTPPPPTAGA